MLPRKLYTRAKSGMAASFTRIGRGERSQYVSELRGTNDTTTVDNINATSKRKYNSIRVNLNCDVMRS